MTSQSKKGERWARKQGDVKRQVKSGKCKMQGTDTAQRERERAGGENFPEQVPAGRSIGEGQFPGGQGGVAGQVEQHRLILTGAK